MLTWSLEFKPLYPGSNWDKEERWILDGHSDDGRFHVRCPFGNSTSVVQRFNEKPSEELLESIKKRFSEKGLCAFCGKPVYHAYPYSADAKPLHEDCFRSTL